MRAVLGFIGLSTPSAHLVVIGSRPAWDAHGLDAFRSTGISHIAALVPFAPKSGRSAFGPLTAIYQHAGLPTAYARRLT